jgi:hypothetical protein
MTDIMAIEILEGKYAGTKYAYNSLSIDEEGMCEFDVRIIDSLLPENYLVSQKEFGRICGQILVVMLEKLTSDIGEIEEYDEFGENYIEEPLQRRTVHKKDSPLSED